MKNTGDVSLAREGFPRRRGQNLRFLLGKRFLWMQRYLGPSTFAVEVGCGAGFAEYFLKAGRLELTDVAEHPWVTRRVDALAMPYGDGTLDVLISNNMVHHLAHPGLFFREATRVLKPGGMLLIQEINCSFTMRWVLKLMSHEGYQYGIDPFDPAVVCNDPADPWSANCALPNLLFDDQARFAAHYPQFEVLETGYSEFLIFFNSGGVIARTRCLPLPVWALKLVDLLDRALIEVWPGFFAGQRKIALRKRA